MGVGSDAAFFFCIAMSNIIFTCTRLAGTGKAGILTPNADGYYRQVIGALRCFNSAGHFYNDEPRVIDLFMNQSSGFNRRVQRGAVRAEVDHPDQPKGMTDSEYEARMYYIDPKNCCAQFASITLDFDNYKDAQGRSIVAIIGEFIPSGVHGAMLEKQLKNGRENVCFSIRAFTIDKYIGGQRNRTLAEVITFDYVNEPGIAIASKYDSLSLESRHEHVVTRHGLQKALQRQTLHLGRESIAITPENLYKSFGWSDAAAPGFAGRW